MRIIISGLLFLAFSHCTLADPFIRFEENGKIGIKNGSGVVVIPPIYEALGWSNGSFSIAGKVTGYKLQGSWGVLNLNNERVTSPLYSSLTIGEGSLLVASKQSSSFKVSTGCINTDGKEIIPFVYTGVTTVHSLRIVAFLREGNLFKHGLVDLENRILIPFQFQNIYPIGSLRFAVENFHGKTALFSDAGKQISGFTIDSISTFVNNVAIIYESGKKGIINREGQLLSEPKYRDVKVESNRIHVRMPDEWHVLRANNTVSETIGADSIVSLGERRFKIETAGTSTLTDEFLKSIQSENVSDISFFRNGRAVVRNKNRYGVIRKNGSTILPTDFQEIILGESFILTNEKKVDKVSWSLRDTLGQRKHAKSYDLLVPKQGSIFPAVKNGYWGALDANGKELIACVYDSLVEISNHQLVVKFKGQYGIISLKEEWLAFPQPHRLKLLNNDRYLKVIGNTVFLCSFNGAILYFTINPIDLHEDHFVEHVHTGGTWVIDYDGRIVSRQLPPDEPTEKIFPATEGLRGIKKNGKFGFIDDQGRLRIANRYEDILPFQEGLAAIKIRNKWGFINRDEKIVIQPVYEQVKPFENGYSFVKQNGLVGIIDKEGKLIVPTRFSKVTRLENGRFLLEAGNLFGLADSMGNILLFPKYESLTDLNTGYVIVQLQGKFGLVTLQGVNTIPILFEKLSYDKENDRFLGLKKSDWSILQN